MYVASFQRDPVLASALVVFAQDKTTGGLVQLPDTQGCISDDGTGGSCTGGTALRGTAAVTVSNDGQHMYVASTASNAVSDGGASLLDRAGAEIRPSRSL